MSSKNQALLDYSLVSLIIGIVFTTVSTIKAPSILFYVLCLVSAVNWYVHSKAGSSTLGIELKKHKRLFLLCSIYLLAVLASKLINETRSGTEIEKAARSSVGLFLLYGGLRYVAYDRLKYALLGVYMAIFFSLSIH